MVLHLQEVSCESALRAQIDRSVCVKFPVKLGKSAKKIFESLKCLKVRRELIAVKPAFGKPVKDGTSLNEVLNDLMKSM